MYMKYQNKSILFEWAGSYLIVLLIPLVTIFLNFHFNMKIIKEEIYSMNEGILYNTGNEIDKILKQQVNVYNYLYGDVFFQSWVSHDKKSAEFYADAARLQKQIQNYIKYTTNISCFIFMPAENYVLHSDYANNASHIYTMLSSTNKEFMEYDEWIEMLSEEYNNEFIVLNCIDGKTNQRCLVYADNLELYGNKPVNIFISVPITQIAQLVNAFDSETQFLMSCRNAIEVINGNKEIITSELETIEFIDGNDFENDKYIGLVKQSSYRDFFYCMLVPKTDFWAKVSYIRNLFVISLMLTVLIAFIAVTFLLRENFRPLNRLLKLTGEEARGNEYYLLEMSYSRLKNENKSLQQLILSQKNALLGSYLLSIMQKRRRGLSANELEFFGIEEDTSVILSGFRVIQEDDLLRFAVDNVFTELMGEENFCYIIDGDFMLYLFFVSHDRVEYLEEKCNMQVEYMRGLFMEKWVTTLEFKEKASSKGLDRLEELYECLIQEFCKQNNEADGTRSINERTRAIVTDVFEYVEEHYTDSDMNVSSIAYCIQKNPKYISRIFKEATGEGILDYINRIRISKAKELIITRQYSAEEVGSMVGYASNQSFRRAFIKIVGMPPGKYMDIMYNNEK